MYSDPSPSAGSSVEIPAPAGLNASLSIALDHGFRMARARREDIPALYQLELSCFDAGMAFNRRQIAALIRNPRADYWVLFAKNQAIAQVLALRQKRKNGLFARIYSVTVSPEHRGKGYARQLLAWEIDYLRLQGVKEICLEVEATALAPITLYGSLDFVVQRQLENYYDEGRHGIKMIKRL